ncbi:MAG: PqqD family protein, partial [Clostridia bacterium]|nr:PqqD family protein [Clostridia bacterium]
RRSKRKLMKINKNVIHREIAGEHILVPVGETALHYNGVFAVSEIGAEIWEMLCSGKDIQEITNLLLQMYDVELDILEKDIENFLEMLQKNGLICE